MFVRKFFDCYSQRPGRRISTRSSRPLSELGQTPPGVVPAERWWWDDYRNAVKQAADPLHDRSTGSDGEMVAVVWTGTLPGALRSERAELVRTSGGCSLDPATCGTTTS